MNIPRWIPRDNIMTAAIIVTSFVALIAFLASYQHQYELVVHHNQPHWVGSLYPLSVDLLIVATTLALWYAASQKWGRPLGVWAVFLTAVAASAIANRADDPSPWNNIGAYISMWPAVAFLGAYETIVWMIRKKRKMDKDGQTLPGVVPEAGLLVPDLGGNRTAPSPNGHQPDQVPAGTVTLPSGRTIQRKPGQNRR